MAHGKKISTDELFPHLDVLMEESPKGPRFGVRFWNWEEGPLLVRFFKNILLGPLIILFGMAWLWAVIADALGWIALPEGNAGTRSRDVTAIARTLPPRISGSAAATLA